MRLSYGIVDLYKIQTYVAVKSKPVIASEMMYIEIITVYMSIHSINDNI
jgi:hypothetical protein